LDVYITGPAILSKKDSVLKKPYRPCRGPASFDGSWKHITAQDSWSILIARDLLDEGRAYLLSAVAHLILNNNPCDKGCNFCVLESTEDAPGAQ